MRVAAIFLAAAVAGCTDSGRALVILHNVAPGEGCTLSASEGGEFIARGRIDTQADTGYVFNPLVQNNAIAKGATEEAQRLALVEGADIDLSFMDGFTPSGSPDLTPTAYFSGAIDANGGITVFSFYLFDKQFMNESFANLASDQVARIDAVVTVFGQLGGGDARSVPFHYSVDVCNGCMTVDLGACTGLPSDYEALAGGECNTLQDVPLECCDDGTVCPAVPATP